MPLISKSEKKLSASPQYPWMFFPYMHASYSAIHPHTFESYIQSFTVLLLFLLKKWSIKCLLALLVIGALLPVSSFINRFQFYHQPGHFLEHCLRLDTIQLVKYRCFPHMSTEMILLVSEHRKRYK